MRKHGGTPSRRDKHVTLAAISPPGVARGRFVGGQQSGLAGCKPPPLFTPGASSCSSQGGRQGEPWGASPRLSAPTYQPTSKKEDKKDKHGVGLQAKTVANAMIRHWLTIFDVPAVICSDRGSQFVGTWFKTMCKHMGIRHAKTVAYHSRSNGRAEVAGRQMFEKFPQLHINEPGRNWYNSLWRVLQAYHDLPGPTGLLPHCILFLWDGVSRTPPWLNHGKVARDANAMMAEADDTAAKVCKALQDEHDKRAQYFKQGKVRKYALQDTVWVERHHKDVLSRHRQASCHVPGVIVRKVGQDVYAVRVGDNKILDRDHTQLSPRAPDPPGRPEAVSRTHGPWPGVL